MQSFAPYTIGLAVLILAAFGSSAVFAGDAPAGQMVIIREPGKNDKRCIVEKSTPQANGTVLHEVRNLETGERYRIVDHRPHKAIMPATNFADSKTAKRPPTPAELAAFAPAAANRSGADHDSWLRGTTSTTVGPPPSVPSIPSVISAASSNWPANDEQPASIAKQIQALRSAPDAAVRETAAVALAGSEAGKKTEVLDTLASAARSDPDSAVRICCLRCLCQWSKELPQVVPTIQELQTDPNETIQQLAHSAIQELGTQSPRPQR
ncbi:MAG TPA: HEAT repeat domain-containing protein [Gemmataceae bacterium]|jgi:hypothetical protein|nr:HEAT repeat domain-containing protein [Gemmataceae bacterium]